jgi:cholesterol oxidase
MRAGRRKRPVENGAFNLFIDTADLNRKKMSYRLFFRDADGKPMTLSGFKRIQDNVGPDIWQDTTTLFTNIFRGHIRQDQETSSPSWRPAFSRSNCSIFSSS